MRQANKPLRHHTRGLWKGGELKAGVFAVLQVYQREVQMGIVIVPWLTAERIALHTGANVGSIMTLFPKWIRSGYIERHSNMEPYGYEITDRGIKCLKIMTDGYLRRRRGRRARWVQVDVAAVIRRLPAFKGGMIL